MPVAPTVACNSRPAGSNGDTIRCFYHGWVYDGTGQCVEQPAEPQPFCDKIRIGGYPVQDYLGLVFAYLGARVGEGQPPPMPRYPTFDGIDGVLEMDSYFRACNYFNNLENSVDSSHVGFVHRGGAGAWDGATEGPIIIEPTADRLGVYQHGEAPRRTGQRGPIRHAQHLSRQGSARRAGGPRLPRVSGLVDAHRRLLSHPVHRQRGADAPR